MSLPAHTAGDSGYHVTIDSESQNRRAFWCTNGEQLVRKRKRRVVTELRPYVEGRLNGAPVTDLVEMDLEYEFDGNYDITGAVSTDPEDTLNDTIDWFTENIVEAAGDDRGRLAVTVEAKGGRQWSGYLVITDFECGDGLDDCRASMTILLPDGKLSPVGS